MDLILLAVLVIAVLLIALVAIASHRRKLRHAGVDDGGNVIFGWFDGSDSSGDCGSDGGGCDGGGGGGD
ncbi:hypothetical protein ASE73_00250 [Sphingomonas sp. Leaf24]|uniref:hypothetical protein n=1 Tax=unclassified Sphingomonas TaxID=196159 RepID=UPI0007010B90|nr:MULTISPECIES: hypothetical protein [unclassified Sphingomonas]KQM22723.1 hypothetical protein ASE50_00255 [Sphingomonas sp. Leaf5]KQM95578.1 hypothetical protein ASE73_00250 [Sphingomonas sp. Leaf24]